jgi:hypothetical protein
MSKQTEFHGPLLTPAARCELNKLKRYAQIRARATTGHKISGPVQAPPLATRDSLDRGWKRRVDALKFIVNSSESSTDEPTPER